MQQTSMSSKFGSIAVYGSLIYVIVSDVAWACTELRCRMAYVLCIIPTLFTCTVCPLCIQFISPGQMTAMSLTIFTKFVPNGPFDNNAALVWIMAWRRIDNKPLSEPILARFTDAYMRHLGDALSWIRNPTSFSDYKNDYKKSRLFYNKSLNS